MQWLHTASLVTLMCLTLGGCWATIQLYSEPWIRMLAVSISLLIQYICLRQVKMYFSSDFLKQLTNVLV